MFRLALISDLNADVHALTDALRHIDEAGCDAIVCCGDLVDYGLFPEETLKILANRRIPTVRGNHDRWAVEDRSEHGGGWDLSRPALRFSRRCPPRTR